MTRKATKTEEAIASDEAQTRSILTGEVLRERGLCPLVIVRARDSGVHVGWLARVGGGDVELLEARRLWQWQSPGKEKARTLNEVATKGLEWARLSEPVPQIALLDACEVIPVSPDAAKSLTTSRWQS